MADGNLSGDFNAQKYPAQEFDRAIYTQDAVRLKELIRDLKLPKDQRAAFLTGELRKACALAFGGAVKLEIIDALIDAGARVNQPQGHDASPFGITCQSNNVTLLRHLIARGADVNADVVQDQFGAAKPLHYACDHGQNPEIVQELLSHRANPNAKGFFGQTPLHAAAAARPKRAADAERLMVVDLLLRHGARVNAVDKSDQTPLFSLLAHSPDAGTVQKLIEGGANLKHVSRTDGSALHLAADRGLHEMVALLIRSGAPLLLKNAEGRTPREQLVHSRNEAPAPGGNPAVDHAETLRLLETAEGKIRPRDVRKFVKHKWGL
jgi:ankyrin repeat protein